MQGTILLPDQDNCIAPWGLARTNHLCFQHIPEGGAYLLQEGWGCTPEPFFKRFIILDADLMLYSASATQFIALQNLKPSKCSFFQLEIVYLARTKPGLALSLPPHSLGTSGPTCPSSTSPAVFPASLLPTRVPV